MQTERATAPYPVSLWPEIDPTLLRQARSVPPAFPLALLPERWRAWVAAPAHSFIPIDFLAQAALAGVAGVCGAGTLVRVNAHWTEPLVLWQAAVGGPSTGKSAAFARLRPLLDAVKPPKDSSDGAAPAVLSDGAMRQLSIALSASSRGVVIWRQDLADWMAEASGRVERPRWLAAWNANDAIPRGNLLPPREREYLAASILAAVRPERLADSLERGESALAARFLYAWPESRIPAALGSRPADDEALHAMLQGIADFAGAPETPGVVPFTPEAVKRLEELAAVLLERGRDAQDLEAEWIGKAVPIIVRLSGVLSLMRWAEAPNGNPRVERRHLDDAHTLWNEYFLPHAKCVFGWAGSSRVDRMAQRAVRWLRREHVTEVSREMIRRDALCQAVNAQEADDVIRRLETGGLLRPVPDPEKGERGPTRRRWTVNPALW